MDSAKYSPQIKKTKNLTDPQVWDQGTPGKTKFVTPVKITLKEANNFPSRHQYPPFPVNSPFLSSFASHEIMSPLTTPILMVFLVIHTGTAPPYKYPLSDTINAIAKVTNSSDCWICPHSCTSPKDLRLLGLPASLKDMVALTAKYSGFSSTTQCSKEGLGQEPTGGQTLEQTPSSKSEGRVFHLLGKASLCYLLLLASRDKN